jgi:FixJ family two-component response regulator
MRDKIVFIVDDDILIQHFLEYSFIDKEGYAVKSFSKAEDCLLNLDMCPDCIILDHYFLGKEEALMTGLEALEKIRNVNKSVPVIVLSNISDKELINNYISNGATSYILKEGFFLNNLFDTFNKLAFN